jgi:hypothetical protein
MRRSTLAATLCILAAAGCGGEDEDPTFMAQEFVTEINRQGVDLRLGEELVTDEPGKQLYAVELEPLGGPRTDSAGEEVHAGGSLSVYEREDELVDEEVRSCEEAADLLCYRAANVVIVLEGGGLEAQQLSVAIQRLSE